MQSNFWIPALQSAETAENICTFFIQCDNFSNLKGLGPD